MRLDKVDPLPSCGESIRNPLIGRFCVNNGSLPLIIEVTRIVQAAYLPGSAEDLVGPEFVLMLCTSPEQQILQYSFSV